MASEGIRAAWRRLYEATIAMDQSEGEYQWSAMATISKQLGELEARVAVLESLDQTDRSRGTFR